MIFIVLLTTGFASGFGATNHVSPRLFDVFSLDGRLTNCIPFPFQFPDFTDGTFLLDPNLVPAFKLCSGIFRQQRTSTALQLIHLHLSKDPGLHGQFSFPETHSDSQFMDSTLQFPFLDSTLNCESCLPLGQSLAANNDLILSFDLTACYDILDLGTKSNCIPNVFCTVKVKGPCACTCIIPDRVLFNHMFESYTQRLTGFILMSRPIRADVYEYTFIDIAPPPPCCILLHTGSICRIPLECNFTYTSRLSACDRNAYWNVEDVFNSRPTLFLERAFVIINDLCELNQILFRLTLHMLFMVSRYISYILELSRWAFLRLSESVIEMPSIISRLLNVTLDYQNKPISFLSHGIENFLNLLRLMLNRSDLVVDVLGLLPRLSSRLLWTRLSRSGHSALQLGFQVVVCCQHEHFHQSA